VGLIILVLQSTADGSNRYIIIVNELAKVFYFWLKDALIEFFTVLDWEEDRVELANSSDVVGRD